MKFRKDFVTNSSSSSFVCEICGRAESGFDIGLSEAGMMECVIGTYKNFMNWLNKEQDGWITNDLRSILFQLQ